MFPDLNKKFQQMLSSMDTETLEKGMKTISELMATEEGQRLAEQLKNMDKEQLMDQLQNIDEKELVSRLENMNMDDISQKVNSMDKEQMAKTLADNPELMNQFNQFMNKK